MILTISTKKIFTSIILALLIFLCFTPALIYAQASGLTYECPPTAGPGGVPLYGNCTFNHLIIAVQNVVNKGRNLALGFSVVVLAWAGYLYMTSGGNSNKRSEANKMLWKVVEGTFLMLAAWLIVSLVTTALLNPNVISTFMP